MHGGNVSKRNLKEFTIPSNEIQNIVIRNSKLAGLRRSASRWTNEHRKTTPIAHPLRNSRDIRKLVDHTEQIRQRCTDETPIRLPRQQSHLWNVSTENQEKSDLNQFPLSISKVAFVVFIIQYLVVAAEWKTGGAHKLKNVNYLRAHRMSSIKEQGRPVLDAYSSRYSEWNFWRFLVCCSQIVYSWICCNRREVWTEHPHTSHFLVFARMFDSVARDIGSRCLSASRHPCFMHLCVWPFFDSPRWTLQSLSHLLLHPPDFPLHLLCGSVRREVPCALPRLRSLTLWSTTPLSHLFAAWRVEAPFSAVSPFRWALQFVLSLARTSLYRTQHLAPGKIPVRMRSPARHFVVPFLYCPCGFGKVNPYRPRYSNPTKSIRLAARRCRPSLSHPCKWGPCPLSGRWLYLQDLINPAFHLPMKIPMTNIRNALFQLTHIYVGVGMLFNHLKYDEVVWIGTRVSVFLMVVFAVLHGMLEVLLDLRFPHILPGERKHDNFRRRENWKAQEREWHPFTSLVVMTPLNWLFALLFPSISLVSTEQ